MAMLRYAITSRVRLGDGEPAREVALLRQATHLASLGIDYFQLREPDLTAAALADLAREILAIFRSHGDRTKLLIHSRPDIAIGTGAHGVHLPSHPGSLNTGQVRSLYASANLPTPAISASCHTLDEVARAASLNSGDAATLILFGPVFEKVVGTAQNETRISAGTGLDRLRAACNAAAPTPVLALGGITPANTSACLAAGAAGIAAIRLFGSLP
jgi:thiamine-phosphate pyrophosphorylase